MSERPLLVLVTGEPGSGKSSLGRLVAGALRVPYLSRDDLRGGKLATAGLWTGSLRSPVPSRESAVDAVVGTVETLARQGVSCVLELVVTPSREAALEQLTAAMDVVVLLTVAAGASERAAVRDRVDPLLQRPAVLEALGVRSVDEHLADPVRARIATKARSDFDRPLLRVATDEGYEPPLEAIVEWVVEQDRARR